jgi:hypothetical protein
VEVAVDVDAGARELLRVVNEQIAELERDQPPERETVAFVCECGSAECRDPVHVTLDEFERLSALAGWHLLRSGHQAPGDVVLRYHGQAVVVCRSRQASAFV